MFKQSVNWDYQWGQIVGRAWADEQFYQRLRTEPAAVLDEFNLQPPAGLRIEVVEETDHVPSDTESVIHLVVPGKPSDAELCDDALFSSAGGAVDAARCGCGGCHGCGRCGGCGGCGACVWCL